MSTKVKVRCDNCDLFYELDNTPHHPVRFYLRLKYSTCPHCNHPRTNETVGPGQFQCAGTCHVIYTITKKRRPIAGKCTACYMAHRRLLTATAPVDMVDACQKTSSPINVPPLP